MGVTKTKRRVKRTRKKLKKSQIKNIVRYVNKEVNSFFAILVQRLTIWFVLIQNWTSPQKESGHALNAKQMVLQFLRLKRMMNTWNSAVFVKKVVNFYVVTIVQVL